MAGTRWPADYAAIQQARAAVPSPAMADLVSDDERSVAAVVDMSDYGSNVEDEQRHVDAAEALSSCPPPSDYWFGAKVMDAVVNWTNGLCANVAQGLNAADSNSNKSEPRNSNQDLSNLSVLDIGTGNGLLLQEFAKQGFSDPTGTDYSQGAVDHAQNLAARDGFSYIKFLVDDILDAKLDRKYQVVMDKGSLDSIGMHPDGLVKRAMYWESVSNLVALEGLLVIASCNRTKDELLKEVETLNCKRTSTDGLDQEEAGGEAAGFQ